MLVKTFSFTNETYTPSCWTGTKTRANDWLARDWANPNPYDEQCA